MDRAALGAQLSSQVDSSRSISAALAARAVNNSSLKALMAAVAAGQGSEDQLTTLQRHVDQITYLRDVTQQTLEICQIRLAKVRDAVFSDLKTCENIFLYLNTRDVLSGVQQTCKAWKDVVDKNRRIQQALFFEPVAPTLEDYAFVDPTGVQRTVTWRDNEYHTGFWIDQRSRKLDARLVTNPTYLMRSWQDWQDDYWNRKEEYNDSAMGRQTASWRRQLLYQPPVPYICDTHDNDWVVDGGPDGFILDDWRGGFDSPSIEESDASHTFDMDVSRDTDILHNILGKLKNPPVTKKAKKTPTSNAAPLLPQKRKRAVLDWSSSGL